MAEGLCLKPGLLRRLINPAFGESTKRWTLILVASTLALAVTGIGGCIAYRITVAGDVGNGAVASFLAVTVPLAGLAGVAYRKPEAQP